MSRPDAFGFGPFGSAPVSFDGSWGDPWADQASFFFPTTTWQTNRMAEYVLSRDGLLRQAFNRVLSYFITEVDLQGEEVGDDEKEQRLDWLNNQFYIKQQLKACGEDYLTYGESFSSILCKFKRRLCCPKCGSMYPLDTMMDNTGFSFRWSGYRFNAKCPRCGRDGDWGKPIDQRGGPDDIYCKRWSNHELEVREHPFTHECQYIWRPYQDHKRLVQQGHKSVLLQEPWDVIQAFAANQYFEIDRDVMHHMKDPVIAGLYMRGRGLPSALMNFRNLYLRQVLLKQVEALALDFTTPMRIISPPPAGRSADSAAGDPILNTSLPSFVSRINAFIKRHRRDPAAIGVLPFPVQYQLLSGDSKQLMPKELLEYADEAALNAAGVPMDFFRGSLQVQSAPMAIRLFESSWTHLVTAMNQWLSHAAGRLVLLLSWDACSLSLVKPDFSDDAEARAIRLQLAAGGDVSKTNALRGIGADYKEELRTIKSENQYKEKLQEQQQEEDEKAQGQKQMMAQPPQQPGAPQDPNAAGGQGGQPQGGQGDQSGQQQGAPPSPTSSALSQGPPRTLDDAMDKAQSIAQQLITMPDSARRTELSQLRSASPMLHGLVRSLLDQMRSQARSQGQQMVMSQMQGGH